MLSIGATKRQVTSTDMMCSLQPWWPTMPWHTRRSRTTWADKNIWTVHLLQHASNLIYTIQSLSSFTFGPQRNCLTFGESEDPVSTMSTEQPGKSSTREGLRWNTGFSLPEESKDPRPRMSFFLGAEMGGRKPSLQVFVGGRKPSVNQNIRCTRWPWLVSLKWYWHDPWLTGHTEDSKEVRRTISATFSVQNHHIIIIEIWLTSVTSFILPEVCA